MTNQEGGRSKRPAPRPTYTFEVVDEVPKSDRRGRSSGGFSPYTERMAKARYYPRQIIKIAEFQTRQGATIAARNLRRRANDGDFGPGVWTFSTSRHKNTSQLFVRHIEG